jgi:hypothetical protein
MRNNSIFGTHTLLEVEIHKLATEKHKIIRVIDEHKLATESTFWYTYIT